MSLTSLLVAKIKATETLSGDLDTIVTAFADRDPFTLESGTAGNQADVCWSDTRSIDASSSETLDLNALTDSAGRTRNFAKVKGLLIVAGSGNANDLIVGNAASNQYQAGFDTATWTRTMKANDIFMDCRPGIGFSSATGSKDKLKFENGGAGTAVTYSIWIVGTSA